MNDEKLFGCIMDKVRKCYKITDIEEILLFEYLVGKGVHFGNDFNKSVKNIQDETGIGRRAQERITEKFSDMGFLAIGIGEYGGIKYKRYGIIWKSLADPAVLGEIMTPGTELYERNMKLFKKLASPKPSAKTKKEAKAKKEAEKLYERICATRLDRNKMYNNGKFGFEPKFDKPTSGKMPHSPKVISKLALLLGEYDEDSLNKAFTAYYDDTLKDIIAPNDIWEYFFTYNEEEGYSVVNRYLNKFNRAYTYER